MHDIWRGQRALQSQAELLNKPLIIQDTDLFSTLGYWKLPHWQERLGPPPGDLIDDALDLQSDLYVVCPSNIPFETDPLRYGGDVRESDDQYWIDLLKKYKLPYIVLNSDEVLTRYIQAHNAIQPVLEYKLNRLQYDRKGL